ncbi:hypothetical protein [Sphingobacterium deserti]|uniref:Uncharacterized protein n=1 Tax=Sphingobacterium deserti TaxID=1229276 RepID=A0A0B8T464_9SPHI|nr:hypothetical protein [Sphingobacterium deserti]KGE16216.1 hypothetical protein DI53_0049 [Sphingobacterium deserti]
MMSEVHPETAEALEDRDLHKLSYVDGECIRTQIFEKIKELVKSESRRVYGK